MMKTNKLDEQKIYIAIYSQHTCTHILNKQYTQYTLITKTLSSTGIRIQIIELKTILRKQQNICQ